MSSITTFPSHSSVPAYVAESRLQAVLQRQQHEQTISAPVPSFNYLVDVPISPSDLSRWKAVFTEKEAEARAALAEAQGEEEGAAARAADGSELNAYFLNADAMLNYLSTDAARRAHVYKRLSPFPSFDPSAVVTLPMTKLLKFRREWLPYRQLFPLHQQRTQFLDALLKHDVVALVGPPGSGRTRQTPIILSETEILKRRRIIVVSATAVAARLTAVRLREERGEDAQSRNVACVLPLHSEATSGSVILTTTAEVLLRQLLTDPVLLDVGCVIFDDVHLRTAETEMCLALLRERVALFRVFENTSKQNSINGSNEGGNPQQSTAIKRLHIVLNAPDETAATPLMDFFKAPVPTTAAGVALGSSSANTHSSSSSNNDNSRKNSDSSGGGGNAAGAGGSHNALLPPCSTELFVLDSSANADSLVRGGSNFVFYVEELVQWFQKCKTEGHSSLCAAPEADLLPFVESVDVVTRVMAAADADFADDAKCREYWCVLLLEAVQHFVQAQSPAAKPASTPAPLLLIVAPSATSSRFIHNYLRRSLAGWSAAATAAENEEKQQPQYSHDLVYSVLDENRTDFETFLAIAQRRYQPTLATCRAHIVITTPELAQTTFPPSVPVDLLIDCARTTHRSFDAAAGCDAYSTEYGSTQSLRHRRAIASSAKGSPYFSTTASSANEEPQPQPQVGEGTNAPASLLQQLPLAARFMTVQLIPKGVLHSVPHRRLSADPAQQHPAFRLSFERYLRLYQVFQAREEAALYARQLAVRAGAASHHLPVAIVSQRVPSLIATHFVAMTSAASGNRQEHLRRIFTAVENYLVAAGHVNVDTTATGELFGAMKPLGVLTTLLTGPLPTSVTRLLVLASLFACPIEATVIAAMWIVGDVFNSSVNSSLNELAGSGATRDELEEEEEELRALTKEARLFFSRDSASDVVSGFNVYKMWLQMRGAEGNSEAVSEEEQGFLDECRVPRRLLLRIEATQTQLLGLLARSGLCESATDLRENSAVSARVLALSDEAVLSGKVQACLTAALYPNCATIEDSRDAKSSAVVLLDSLHVLSAGRSNQTGTAVVAKRLGVFSENSVVNDADTAAHVLGKPFVFLDKVLGTASGGTAATAPVVVSVLEQAAPIQPEASILFCGEGHMKPKAAPTRCRGWTPCVTSAWRHTRRASQLPPPAQLPVSAIRLQAYDTVKSESVIMSTDDNFQFTMRATTSRWLLQLRGHIQAQLKGFLVGDQAQASVSGGQLFSDVAQAWEWLWRRRSDGANWLREERRVLALATAADTNEKEDAVKNLYGFYVFTTETTATPVTVTPLTARPAKKKGAGRAAAAATASGAAITTAAAEEVKAASSSTAFSTLQAGPTKMFTGKRPSDDVAEVIRMCVEGVAKKRTREHEALLLADDPVSFGFLNPENELHEYYLYCLREAAPSLEVLGDNLEELIEFLEKLETNLTREIGYKEPSAASGGGKQRQQHQQQQKQQPHQLPRQQHQHQQQQWSEMTGNEDGDEDGYYGSGATGLQVEQDAAVRMKKQIGLNFAPRPGQETQFKNDQQPQQQRQPMPITTTAAAAPTGPTLTASTGPTAPAPAVSGQQTLLEKLMAMKNNAGAGGDGSASAGAIPSIQSAQTNAAPSGYAANPQPQAEQQQSQIAQPQSASTADLITLLQSRSLLPASYVAKPIGDTAVHHHSDEPQKTSDAHDGTAAVSPVPGQDREGEETSASAPAKGPSTAELLALLGVPQAPQQLQQQYEQHLQQDDEAQPDELEGALASSYGMAMAMQPHGFYGAPGQPLPGGYMPDPMMAYYSASNSSNNMAAYQSYQFQQQHQFQQQMQQQAYRPPRVNPLSCPPPPLPAKVVEDGGASSVIVYPLPESTEGNLHLVLALALGNALDMKVGPTAIVGRVARITVRNPRVAARAVDLHKFRCLGQKVYVFKNDRILDNPDGVSNVSGGFGARHARGEAGANSNTNERRDGNRNISSLRTSGQMNRGRGDWDVSESTRPPHPPGDGGKREREEGAAEGVGAFARVPPRRFEANENGARVDKYDGEARETEEEDEDNDDPTAAGFNSALPPGITVGALSGSDSDAE